MVTCHRKDNLPEELVILHSGRSASENEKKRDYHPGFWVRLGLIEITL